MVASEQHENLLVQRVLPGLAKIEGYVLRRSGEREVEFVVINMFTSIESVERFAGVDYQIPVFEPEARQLLIRIEPVATHYTVCANTIRLLDDAASQ